MSLANRPLVLSAYDAFEPLPKSPYHFIIWNVYLTDKLTPLCKTELEKMGIIHIIAILPEEEDFKALNTDIEETEYTVLPYHHNHTPVFQREQYDAIAEKVDEIARRPRNTNRNVLVFCNNGYQRSLPFLVYYMTKFHADEFPTINKAVDVLLNMIGSQPSFEEKVQILEQIQQLILSSSSDARSQ